MRSALPLQPSIAAWGNDFFSLHAEPESDIHHEMPEKPHHVTTRQIAAAVRGGLDLARLPKHVAVIMDGNGRWARRRGLPRWAGHKAGAESARRVAECATELGLKYLTIYAFSMENWERPSGEIRFLMGLLARFLKEELKTALANNVRIAHIGDLARLPAAVREALLAAERKTSDATGLTLCMALSYGARDEIVRAVRRIAREAASGRLRPEDITERTVSDRLDTSGVPDPDLLIRTAGEMRVSNFLLWQISYAELWVTKKTWPEFGKKDFLEAVADFQKRERKFGSVAPKE